MDEDEEANEGWMSMKSSQSDAAVGGPLHPQANLSLTIVSKS